MKDGLWASARLSLDVPGARPPMPANPSDRTLLGPPRFRSGPMRRLGCQQHAWIIRPTRIVGSPVTGRPGYRRPRIGFRYASARSTRQDRSRDRCTRCRRDPRDQGGGGSCRDPYRGQRPKQPVRSPRARSDRGSPLLDTAPRCTSPGATLQPAVPRSASRSRRRERGSIGSARSTKPVRIRDGFQRIAAGFRIAIRWEVGKCADEPALPRPFLVRLPLCDRL